MSINHEAWTKKGSVVGSQDDCVIEVTKEYIKINPSVSWDNVNDEDRYDAAEIANNAINKMMGKL
jgi:hypothetical protein